MKTYSTKAADIKREHHVVDAADKTLGRLVSQIVKLLMGKHKTIFAPNMDTGDYVVILNADKVRVTGNKIEQKNYYHHSGYPGGLKTTIYKDMMKDHPERIIEHAVRGMLPRTKLGDAMYRKLKVYTSLKQPPVKVNKEAEKAG